MKRLLTLLTELNITERKMLMSPPKKYWISENQLIPHETRSIFNEYLLSLKLENKAEATVSKYRSIIEKFLVGCTVPIEELTAGDVLAWFLQYSINKKPKTIDLVLACLSSFFTFCLAEEYMETVVIKNRWRPKIPYSLPNYLNEQEYARVKLAAEKLPIRDRAVILFLFSSGVRRSEVAQLTIQDVNLVKRTVEVVGKGKKIRHVHISEECALVLREYLQTRTADESGPLFLNKFKQHLGAQGIYKITTSLGKLAGLKRRLNPHSCRHTFATNMLARGTELEFIADEMGHADLNTTRVYARIPSEEMMITYQNIMG